MPNFARVYIWQSVHPCRKRIVLASLSLHIWGLALFTFLSPPNKKAGFPHLKKNKIPWLFPDFSRFTKFPDNSRFSTFVHGNPKRALWGHNALHPWTMGSSCLGACREDATNTPKHRIAPPSSDVAYRQTTLACNSLVLCRCYRHQRRAVNKLTGDLHTGLSACLPVVVVLLRIIRTL